MTVRSELPLPELRNRLETWASTVADRDCRVVGDLDVPQANGMLAATVLFDVVWEGDSAPERLVLRPATDPDHVPPFDVRPIDVQYRLLAALGRLGLDVPVVRWLETDASWIGRPFLVMDCIDGIVASDNPPYVFGGWPASRPPDECLAIERAAVHALARVHAVDLDDLRRHLPAADLDAMQTSASLALQRVRERYDWGRRGRRSELVEDLLAWCGDHLPEESEPPSLCWGDARLGNLLYRDTEVVSILDWDGAGIGPRELDVGWMIAFHAMFQDIAASFGVKGLPAMFRRATVIRVYEAAAGVELAPLAFYEGLALLKIAVATFRGHHVEIYGYDESAPLDSRIPHAPLINRLLAGEYWSDGGQ